MSYYFRKKYNFSAHGLLRARSRLKLGKLSDVEVSDICLKLIESSHDVSETKTLLYVKVNGRDLYFVIRKSENVILTLSPIKPGKMLEILEKNQ